MPEIVSIQIGKPRTLKIGTGSSFRSAIRKEPVTGRVYLGTTGFDGDGVGDPRVHGGPDKAVCVYSLDHYPFWEAELGVSLKPGAFGENLSVSGWDESSVSIGDVFQIGEAEVQVTQPRQPCHKLNKIFQRQEMACRVQSTGYTGFYLRVLKPGWVAPGDAIRLVHKEGPEFSVDAYNQFLRRERVGREELERAREHPALSEDWKKLLGKLLRQKRTSSPEVS